MSISPVRPRSYSSGPTYFARSLASAQVRARELATSGAVEGTLVVCDSQTQGRGRLGRSWHMAASLGIACSYIVRELEQSLGLLPLAAALAVCEACEASAAIECRIKWPNDVWAGERKLAGILIEARPQDGWCIVGSGINVNQAKADLPAEIADSATSLLIAAGMACEREMVLEQYCACLGRWIIALRSGADKHLLESYRGRDALTGREIAWQKEGGKLQGIASGIDDSGNLVVSQEGELTTLKSGEVELVRRT